MGVMASGVAERLSPADEWAGTGLRFPLRPVAPVRQGDDRPETSGLGWLSGMALIRQSIETILDTEPGERVMEPLFGCGLRRYLMAPNTVATRTGMQRDIKAALETWEPRIQLTDVSVTGGEDPALVYIDIAYVRRADLRPDNLVYPYYLR